MEKIFTYQVRYDWYDVEFIMASPRVISYKIVHKNGLKFLEFSSKYCLDHWVA